MLLGGKQWKSLHWCLCFPPREGIKERVSEGKWVSLESTAALATVTKELRRPACTFSNAVWDACPENSCSRERWQSSPPHQPAVPPKERDSHSERYCSQLCAATAQTPTPAVVPRTRRGLPGLQITMPSRSSGCCRHPLSHPSHRK